MVGLIPKHCPLGLSMDQDGPFVWNISRFNSSWKRHEVLTLLTKRCIEIVKSLETKVNFRRSMGNTYKCRNLGYKWTKLNMGIVELFLMVDWTDTFTQATNAHALYKFRWLATIKLCLRLKCIGGKIRTLGTPLVDYAFSQWRELDCMGRLHKILSSGERLGSGMYSNDGSGAFWNTLMEQD